MVSAQTHTHTPNSPPLRQAAGRSLTFHDSLASLKHSAPSTTGFLCFPPGGERQRRAGELTAARCRLLSSSSLMVLTCCPEISTHCHTLRRRLLPAALGALRSCPPVAAPGSTATSSGRAPTMLRRSRACKEPRAPSRTNAPARVL